MNAAPTVQPTVTSRKRCLHQTAKPCFYSAIELLGKLKYVELKALKDVLAYKAALFQTHRNPFSSSNVIAAKSSLKLASFLKYKHLHPEKYLYISFLLK